MSALTELSRANARELIRDRRTAFASVVLPIFFLALLVGMAVVTGDDVATSVGRLLPVAAMLGLGSVCFFGTVSPTVDMRQRGTLRLLGTTPLARSTFLVGLAPVRVVITGLLVAVVIAVAAWSGSLDPSRLPAFVVTCALSVGFLMGVGFVLAGILPNVETANNVLGLLLVVLVAMGGAWCHSTSSVLARSPSSRGSRRPASSRRSMRR